MGQHGSLSTELRLRADDLKHLVRPQYVKGLTRADVAYARPLFGTEPLAGQEVLVVVRRFRHHIQGSGALLSDHWQALTYDLAAIHGTLATATTSFQLRGVTSHLFDRFLDRPGAGSGNDATWHLFVLGPGELVRGVDIAWGERHQLTGLRVQTNQRQSQWFGQRRGVVKSVTAPQGYFINALERLRTNPNELGLRLCPIPEHLARSLSPGFVAHEKSLRVGEPGTRDGTQTEFSTAHEHVRALVVACGDAGIADLHVLSSEMFASHLAKREEPLPPREHLFFLRHGEFVTAVDVHVQTADATTIAALRFHTNLTKSPWYGTRDGKETSKKAHVFQAPTVPRALQICGFHGTFGASRLGSLGVFYNAAAVGERDHVVKLGGAQPAPKRLE